MKCFRYCCCLLCALVLSSTVFSINVHAKESSVPTYYVNHSVTLSSQNGKHDWRSINFNLHNGSQDNIVLEKAYLLQSGLNYVAEYGYEFVTNEPPLVEKGGNSVITVFDAYFCSGMTNQRTNYFFYRTDFSNARLLVTYADTTMEYIDDVVISQNDKKITLETEFVPNKDIVSLKFLVTQNINMVGEEPYYITYYLGEMFGADKGYTLSVSQESEETGVLKGLLAKVNEFKNSVTDKFNSLIQGIVDLPSKLWNLISDGLKNLFVPDEDFIVQYKEDMNTMLEDKLGAVYQVVNITLESWDRIGASDEQDSIELPETTINLPENNKFSFGGYDVKIVPDGFSVLANAIKLIGGICITILFVNGLRKRYDEVMGVEK